MLEAKVMWAGPRRSRGRAAGTRARKGDVKAVGPSPPPQHRRLISLADVLNELLLRLRGA